MSSKRDPLGPYRTPDELARGKRQTAINLVIAVLAVTLSGVAGRHLDDDRLATVYLLAGLLHFLGALGPAIRWSRTGEFETVDAD